MCIVHMKSTIMSLCFILQVTTNEESRTMPKFQKKDSSVPSKSQDELDDEEIDLYITPAATLEHEAGLVWLKNCIDNEINSRLPWPWKEGSSDIPLVTTDDKIKEILEKEHFVNFLCYLQFLAPKERDNQEHWSIPKDLSRRSLETTSKLIENMLTSESISEAKELSIMKCKGCGNMLVNLLQHLNKSKRCPASYSELEMEQLKIQCKTISKHEKKEWYKRNKARLNQQNTKYHQENREAILQRKKNKYSEKRMLISKHGK